jgi:ribonuclease HI
MPKYIKTSPNGEIIAIIQSVSNIETNDLLVAENIEVSSNSHYVKNGVLTEYTAEQKQKRITRPDYPCAWIPEQGWIDVRTGEQLKQAKYLEINLERTRRNYLPIKYDNKLFDADEISQTNLNNWISAVNSGTPLPENFAWRDFNNTNQLVDVAWLRGLHAAITNRTTELYASSWAKKQQLENIGVENIPALQNFYVVPDYTANGNPNWPGIPPRST